MGRDWPVELVSHARSSGAGTTGSRSNRVRLGIICGTHKMERHVRVIADDPAMVTRRPGWNVKEGTGTEFVNRAVFHRSGGTAGKHQAYMLAVAMRCAYSVSNIDGPPPPRLVRARPIVMFPIRTTSNLPFSNRRTSSGSSNRFKITSSISGSSLHGLAWSKVTKQVLRNLAHD